MKGVPVKFRAKTEKGDFVYGDLIKGHYIECIPKIKPVKKRSVHVDKDSVAQLCGYDADGKEIYEGDKLFDSEHNDFVTAEISPCVHLQFYRKVDD